MENTNDKNYSAIRGDAEIVKSVILQCYLHSITQIFLCCFLRDFNLELVVRNI